MSAPVEKMVLVPESQFHRLQRCEEQQQQQQLTSKSEIMSAVKRPEERELVKTYHRMENALNDPHTSEQEKAAQHAEALNEFTVLRDRVTGQDTRDVFKPAIVPVVDVVGDGVADMMPKTLQRSAQQLLQRLRENNNIISWTPTGEVTIRGERLVGSNIADLVGDVIRSQKAVQPNRDRFLKVLADVNAPEQLVRNKTALTRYRQIKTGKQSPTLRLRTGKRPPGLPLRLKHFSRSSLPTSDDGEDENTFAGDRRRLKKKLSRIRKVKRAVEKKIAWKNLYK